MYHFHSVEKGLFFRTFSAIFTYQGHLFLNFYLFSNNILLYFCVPGGSQHVSRVRHYSMPCWGIPLGTCMTEWINDHNTIPNSNKATRRSFPGFALTSCNRLYIPLFRLLYGRSKKPVHTKKVNRLIRGHSSTIWINYKMYKITQE